MNVSPQFRERPDLLAELRTRFGMDLFDVFSSGVTDGLWYGNFSGSEWVSPGTREWLEVDETIPLIDCVHPADRDSLRIQLHALQQGQPGDTPFNTMVRFGTVDASLQWVRIRGQVVTSGAGVADRFLAVLTDMSAIVDVETLNANRQKADSDTIRQLQESNEHLQLFAESIGAGFWSRTGEDTSTITWSDEVWSLLGYDEPEPYRYGLFREHLVGEDRQRYADALNRMHEQQVPLDIEVCARLKNGCRRWLRVTAKIVHDSLGRLDKVIGAVQDIDKLHRLQDLNAQLTTTTKALQHQSQQTSASNSELRALAYASSHDLRTPMNSLSLILQVISEEIEEGNYEYVRQLARDGLEITRQGSDLVEDVLDYLRVADTSMPEESLDLSQLTQSVLEQLSAAEPAVMDVTTVTVKGPLPQVQGCRIQIRLLIYNLISNAVKFRRSDYTHSVIVEAVAEDGYEGVAVTDNGIGIAEHKQAEVFDMFKRLNRKSDYQGSGLGLALCQRIALNHRARLLLRSEPGCGSTFTIWFPVESV